MNWATVVVVWLGLAISALPLFYILVTTLAALPPRVPAAPTQRSRRIAILIPAHNESLLIHETVTQALGQSYPADSFVVFVIADNCTDDTAVLARQAGARVLERHDNPGKGQGLHDALAILLQEDWAAFLILDADSHLHPDTLAELDRALASGARAVQIRYGVLNPRDSLRTRAMELSTASFNALRPRGRVALGLSAGINGNGFCLARETVLEVPYLAHSIVEDIEYHMLLLKAGIAVDFLDQVWVKAQMPLGGRGATVQRVRWERGRIITMRNHAPDLVRALRQGQRRAFDGLVDVLMPPVSLVVLGLIPALTVGSPLARGCAVAGLAILLLHYLIAAWRYGSIVGLVMLIGYIPWYLVWKTYVVIASLLTERHLPWMRTDRHQSNNPPPSR
jgi:cellulose synthase/poly-beta-1,6-N-acetylglucosamine synthase-like glycosyltransferase